LLDAAARSRICLMCAEREPLDCHRCLLVARIAGRGLAVGHILHDGTIEPQAATEQRLLALDGEGCDLFAAGQRERLAAAYRRRARAVAFRQKVPAPRVRGGESMMRLSLACSLAAPRRHPVRRWRRIPARSTQAAAAARQSDAPSTPAKELFARKTTPDPVAARSIGFYATAASPAPSRCRSTARPGR
jgi:hypothetical protein